LQLIDKVQKIEHHKALPYKEVTALVADLMKMNSQSAKALAFTILTVARTGETIGATPQEIDRGEKLWVVPSERMKAGREHRVPLNDDALGLLGELSGKYLFSGAKPGKPLSNMAMLMLLRRMKVEGVTVHGFRSTFRVWAAEVANAPREVAEMSLAHKVGSNVERAYFRSDLLDRRRALMERWTQFVTGGEGKVVRLSTGASAAEK
jgi:integrase